MTAAPLLVWSWRSLPGATWPAAQRVRALAAGHALASAAGYRCVSYGDAVELEILVSLRWPWETRALPEIGKDRVPAAFWSGTKLTALRHARELEKSGVAVVHVDHDGFVVGPLAQLDAPLYAQNAARLSDHAAFYPDLADAFGSGLPTWHANWRARGTIHECGLVGGADRDAVTTYATEALECARALDGRGTLAPVHTFTLEQGIHEAIAHRLNIPVGFALDTRHRGTGYATWPGRAKSEIPLRRLLRHVPTRLRAAMDAAFGPLPTPHPLHAAA